MAANIVQLYVLLFALFTACRALREVTLPPFQQPTNCGNRESGYRPCQERALADDWFLSCCQQYVPRECHRLCQYENDRTTANRLLYDVVKNDGCSLSHINKILFCAEQNHNDEQCCRDQGLADERLGVGDHCMPMCDVRIREWRWENDHETYVGFFKGIETLTSRDLVCLYNWNVIMHCHHAGLKADWSKKK